MRMNSIEDIKAAHGGWFFTSATMRFWSSRIHDKVYPIPGYGVLFTTSERDYSGVRGYTVRYCNLDGSIYTVGELCEHGTRHRVQAAARVHQAKVLDHLSNMDILAIMQ